MKRASFRSSTVMNLGYILPELWALLHAAAGNCRISWFLEGIGIGRRDSKEMESIRRGVIRARPGLETRRRRVCSSSKNLELFWLISWPNPQNWRKWCKTNSRYVRSNLKTCEGSGFWTHSLRLEHAHLMPSLVIPRAFTLGVMPHRLPSEGSTRSFVWSELRTHIYNVY